MPESTTSVHREVRIAAIFAFIGSGFFLLAGSGLAVATAVMLNTTLARYPGASLSHAGPDFWNIMRLIGLSAGIQLGVGATGIVVGTGLLRLRSWARDAALAWSLGTTLLFMIILATPQSLLGVRPNPTGILMFLLFLLPVSAWWIRLFTRAEIVALFGPIAGTSPTRRIELPDWLRENLLGKSILVIGAVLIVGFAAARISYRMSPKRDLERARDALTNVHSWHYHTVRYIQGQPPETIDIDFWCPSFKHFTTSYINAHGETQVRESIYYFPNSYNRVDGQWVAANRRGYADPGIPECQAGPIGADPTSLSLESVIEDGRVTRGSLRQLSGSSCREYAIATPTPHDPAERIFMFNICINEEDHLPRETRRNLPYPPHEAVSEFSEWNAMTEPDLPAEIPR
jgi:hypothetical protein